MKTEYYLGRYQEQVNCRLDEWVQKKFLARLWHRDPTLWFPQPTAELSDRLGWMDLPHTMIQHLVDLRGFAEQVRDDGYTQVLLLGMGGSSLAPEVFQGVLGHASGYPELHVLDSTHPTEICRVEEMLDLEKVLFVVSSKSGTTLETLSLFHYFWERLHLQVSDPGRSFIAVTDPGSPLEELAGQRNFRRTFLAPRDVGGRFSALSYFGLVPAALIGVNLTQLMASASRAAYKNGAVCNKTSAPGIVLGAVLGEIAKERNKLTFLTSPGLQAFPAWLEQLIAESTGKNGKGIIPIINEPRLQSRHYGSDRCFVLLMLSGEDNQSLIELGRELTQAGHPVLTRVLAHPYDLAAEMYHWEIAVAAASVVLGVHPFNQPDVQLTKELTQKAMQNGEEGDIFLSDPVQEVDISQLSETWLTDWIPKAAVGDYIALQAFLPRFPEIETNLQNLRQRLLNKTGLATTLGYGPRFLHSTGQLYKGGPSGGFHLQLVDTYPRDLEFQGLGYSFGQLIRAQALGDYQALAQGAHQILRINLGMEAAAGLRTLVTLVGD